MGASPTFLQEQARQAGIQGAIISAHSGDPGTTGANEIAGGSPAYARKTTVWGAPAMNGAAGQITGSVCTFDIPPSTSVLFFGVWKDATTFLYGKAVTPGVTINAAGNGKVDITPTFQSTLP